MSETTLPKLTAQVRDFARDRDWETFHSPKNLAAAISVEAGELLERFLWISPEDSRALPPARLEKVAEEMADVLIYLVRLADVLGIDLLQVSASKLRKNAERYPVEKAKGNALKYSEFDPPGGRE